MKIERQCLFRNTYWYYTVSESIKNSKIDIEHALKEIKCDKGNFNINGFF